MGTRWKTVAISTVSLLMLSGCQHDLRAWFGQTEKPQHRHEPKQSEDSAAVMANEAKEAVQVNILGKQGTTIGTAKLTPAESGGGVRIELEAASLSPGPHGFHVHETGKCEAPDFTSAGAHFNPEARKHGLNNSEGPHTGDLPNLEADQQGKVKADFVAKQLTLEPGQPHSLRKPGGTAFVIHEKADDFRTDPAGNAGGRIGCGVIR
ncbi:superoxide dismutase, Cu-Zn family [Paenibacillus tianmuensis]|uniref:Superoxide dismutase [Cu-Zn] n=1 Tax=Paenibacillus tianmuensis TaxID=624147 RepID=A0A1G4RUM5_9BACL|nr:superoxide dismutase family protein [Paenibacillus tianmuensis]SCW60530.1 superoxide dismutase, Cu-Zn family [Paenibacillus tianmuensis]